jgi:Mrp family chromosome partitioning ATPase
MPATHIMDNDTMPAAAGGENRNAIPEGRAAQPLARLSEPNPLSTRVLEERRLIHRNSSIRKQADAFRELRTRLLGMAPGKTFVTLVVPVDHRSGGSFVARNLAAAFAFDESKNALLVDCDARYPSQHTALGVTVSGGLMDYLGDPSVELADVIHHTGIPRMHLVPAGAPREATGENFSSFRMRTMVDSLRSQSPDRYLILDGPAVQGSPDAWILADLADFVVIVAGYGRSTADDIERAAAKFAPGKVAGIVFNNGV